MNDIKITFKAHTGEDGKTQYTYTVSNSKNYFTFTIFHDSEYRINGFLALPLSFDYDGIPIYHKISQMLVNDVYSKAYIADTLNYIDDTLNAGGYLITCL